MDVQVSLTRASEISCLVFMYYKKNISNKDGTVSKGIYFDHIIFLLDRTSKRCKNHLIF